MYSTAHGKVSAAASKALGERIAAFLRQTHPAKTAQNVSADTGLPASTVAKWLEGASTPGVYAGFKLADAYGPDFIAAVWPERLGFLAKAARMEERERLLAMKAEIDAKLEAM